MLGLAPRAASLTTWTAESRHRHLKTWMLSWRSSWRRQLYSTGSWYQLTSLLLAGPPTHLLNWQSNRCPEDTRVLRSKPQKPGQALLTRAQGGPSKAVLLGSRAA